MNRSLVETFAVAKALLGAYRQQPLPEATPAQKLAWLKGVLAILIEHKVTLEELQAILGEVEPFLVLFGVARG